MTISLSTRNEIKNLFQVNNHRRCCSTMCCVCIMCTYYYRCCVVHLLLKFFECLEIIEQNLKVNRSSSTNHCIGRPLVCTLLFGLMYPKREWIQFKFNGVQKRMQAFKFKHCSEIYLVLMIGQYSATKGNYLFYKLHFGKITKYLMYSQ